MALKLRALSLGGGVIAPRCTSSEVPVDIRHCRVTLGLSQGVFDLNWLQNRDLRLVNLARVTNERVHAANSRTLKPESEEIDWSTSIGSVAARAGLLRCGHHLCADVHICRPAYLLSCRRHDSKIPAHQFLHERPLFILAREAI
jgi:hypothetical protein